MITRSTADEIQSLIASHIADTCAPGEVAGAIAAAIMQARTAEEIELLAQALIVRKRSLPGSFGLRATPQIKRIAILLARAS